MMSDTEALNNLLQVGIFFIIFFGAVCITGLIFGVSDKIKDRNYRKRIEFKESWERFYKDNP